MKNVKPQIAIVGAGLGGIALARQLTQINLNVVLFEKSRGVGGRIATRRLGESFFNYGVHDFEIGQSNLSNLVQVGVNANILKRDGNRCHAIQGINLWTKLLSENLEIKKEIHVDRLSINTHEIQLIDKNNEILGSFDTVVLALPAPQAFDLLSKSELVVSDLALVNYESCIKIMFKLKEQKEISKLSTYFENFTFRQDVYAADLKQDWHGPWLTLDKEVIKENIIKLCQLDLNDFSEFHAHKWRYSRVIESISPVVQFQLKEKQIYLVGDYFYGNDLNSVLKSVEAVFTKLVN
ncbi:MAG: NAD(P)-binding protein [Bacteriovoracaceae bacterium]